MPPLIFHNPILKAAVVAVAVPTYIIGTVSWIIISYGILSEATSPWQWPLHDIVIGSIFCFALFPLAIVLMCMIAAAYFPLRVAITLLLPIPAMIIGIFLTPGNLAPFHLAGAALVCLFLMLFLLQYWARRDPAQGAKHHAA